MHCFKKKKARLFMLSTPTPAYDILSCISCLGIVCRIFHSRTETAIAASQ